MATDHTGFFQKQFHIDNNHILHPITFDSCKVYQIGRLYCTEQTVVAAHTHVNWFEITVVTNGKGTIFTNEVGVPVQGGDIYLSFPRDLHEIHSDPDEPLKYDFFAFVTDVPNISAALREIEQTHRDPSLRLFRDETVAALVAQAISEFDKDGPYREQLLNAILLQIIIHLVRAFSNRDIGPKTHISDSRALCYQMMNYIDTHIRTMTSLSELSEITNYNYSYLSSVFRRETSTTLADYYRHRRMETARLLLLDDSLSATQIAEALGYSSIYTFSRAFKDSYGLSPRDYRQKELKK